jgi:hypothetical protein
MRVLFYHPVTYPAAVRIEKDGAIQEYVPDCIPAAQRMQYKRTLAELFGSMDRTTIIDVFLLPDNGAYYCEDNAMVHVTGWIRLNDFENGKRHRK